MWGWGLSIAGSMASSSVQEVLKEGRWSVNLSQYQEGYALENAEGDFMYQLLYSLYDNLLRSATFQLTGSLKAIHTSRGSLGTPVQGFL